jgi:nitroreductase
MGAEPLSYGALAFLCACWRGKETPWQGFGRNRQGKHGRLEESQKWLRKQEEKAFRAPVVIAVAAVAPPHPKALFAEELAAVHAAVQNLLLAAHALGLGAIWRTGAAAYHPKMKSLFGLTDQDQLVGFIYLGYPDMPHPRGTRSPWQTKTTWMDTLPEDPIF